MGSCSERNMRTIGGSNFTHFGAYVLDEWPLNKFLSVEFLN